MNVPLHKDTDEHSSHVAFALVDSSVLSKAKLILSYGDQAEDVQLDLDPQRHLEDGRKVSVIAQQFPKPLPREEASVLYGPELSYVQYAVSLTAESSLCIASIQGVDYPIRLDLAPYVAGEYEVRIALHRKTPRIAEGPLEPEQQAMVKYAQVNTVHIMLFPSAAPLLDSTSAAKWTRNHHMFDSYGRRGFILADLELLSGRVAEMFGPGNHNLLELFTEGRLDSLLEEGLMAVVWGLTPWCYSLYSPPNEQAAQVLVWDKLGEQPVRQAIYYIDPKVQRLSIIPANELAFWADCIRKDWPVVDVSGEGETLRLDLYVQIAEAVNELHENPIPSFVLTRSAGKPDMIMLMANVVIVEEIDFPMS
ncbi:hypothetical protein HUB98_03175 [Paenibacillus barcinonensis]|uniref:Uncharacterized protein n=1 Tax=Paenibacillus barcinonensis TaxID=198119 RepID=A0A2V4V8S4_PAEBA|nr:hypothetical protein [Paenibacillus barcinonensis]PYE49175.1 hypothetical protein DFQ00_106155 [Paenibacillus barcinonensis]QKS55410.1 hypothetical protein HUB98_03175 [Paenibacillus barcinonensis]